MLVVNFSIAVEATKADEVQNKMIEDYGIEIYKRWRSYEPALSGNKRVPKIYLDCYAPIDRLKMLTQYLNTDFKDVAILTY